MLRRDPVAPTGMVFPGDFREARTDRCSRTLPFLPNHHVSPPPICFEVEFNGEAFSRTPVNKKNENKGTRWHHRVGPFLRWLAFDFFSSTDKTCQVTPVFIEESKDNTASGIPSVSLVFQRFLLPWRQNLLTLLFVKGEVYLCRGNATIRSTNKS